MKNLVYILVVFFLFACSSQNENGLNEDQQILARVGKSNITVADFKSNYELGYGHLKQGKNRKKSYLNFMINEKLLALEGYKQGLDQSEYVKRSEEELKKILMIEFLIKQEVKDKIKVSKEEIIEEMNKSKVRFKFRYWYESELEDAKIISERMKQNGYAKVVEDILRNNTENKINPEFLETDYIGHNQISPDLLLAIKDLPIGEISDPIKLNNAYYIFQVLDIRRNAITENEYNANAPAVEQTLFYKKFDKMLVDYGTKLLDEQSIVTKRKAFNMLAEALQEWKKNYNIEKTDFLKVLDNHSATETAIKSLVKNSNEVFFEYSTGHLTFAEFLELFDASKFKKNFESKSEFINYLHNSIALTIRDYFLVQQAKINDIEKNQSFVQQLNLWRDKWVFEVYYNQIVKETKKKKAFNKRIEQIKNNYKIEINDAVLDTIKVMDSKKSRWATMQILRIGTNKPAYPVVDPSWVNPLK